VTISQDILEKDVCTLSDQELFERMVYKIRKKYDFQISDADARAAARNLAGFYQALLDLKQQSGHGNSHE
jgi:hypothetical protein